MCKLSRENGVWWIGNGENRRRDDEVEAQEEEAEEEAEAQNYFDWEAVIDEAADQGESGSGEKFYDAEDEVQESPEVNEEVSAAVASFSAQQKKTETTGVNPLSLSGHLPESDRRDCSQPTLARAPPDRGYGPFTRAKESQDRRAEFWPVAYINDELGIQIQAHRRRANHFRRLGDLVKNGAPPVPTHHYQSLLIQRGRSWMVMRQLCRLSEYGWSSDVSRTAVSSPFKTSPSGSEGSGSGVSEPVVLHFRPSLPDAEKDFLFSYGPGSNSALWSGDSFALVNGPYPLSGGALASVGWEQSLRSCPSRFQRLEAILMLKDQEETANGPWAILQNPHSVMWSFEFKGEKVHGRWECDGSVGTKIDRGSEDGKWVMWPWKGLGMWGRKMRKM
ncbi:hypothetical protein Dimus_013402 [Dionaea muscipula]